jgi:uncharacterized membrane protein
MTEFLFMWLEKIGYAHPIHAPVTHVPMGMILCAGVFLMVAHFANKPTLRRTALHCYVLGLIGIPLTMLLGYIDWQHFYQGAWTAPIIIKIVTASFLFASCIFNIIQLRKDSPKPWTVLIGGVVSMAMAGLIGFEGGEVMYGQ